MTAPVIDRVPAPSTGPAKRRMWPWLIVVGFVGLVALATFVVFVGANVDRPGETRALDPGNTRADGTAALAAVLSDRGVPVTVVRGRSALMDADRPDAATTVVVTSSDTMNSTAIDRFRERTAGAGRVIFVAPSTLTLETFGLPINSAVGLSATQSVRGACAIPGIATDDTVLRDTIGYESPPGADNTTPCFTSDGASELIRVAPTAGRPEVIVMTGAMLQNQQITRFDNAGVALRVFGSHERVLWYVPKYTDGAADEPSGDVPDIPAAIGPLVILAGFGLLTLMVWRGRRFGPLVGEPLPAVVKAIETTEARGRLYHRAGAHDRAAAQLRVHTIGSIADRLGLPFDAGRVRIDSPDSIAAHPAMGAIIDATARATGRDPRAVAGLLTGPLPHGPDDLLRFTTDLTILEKEVRPIS